ncbi:hypothetical protein B0J18DRAFT_433693 [Chaetomium sp. MPI-SDFR-AT-0129]|nr:hypothetical protein B0J18DRAFT_433693 [Chaetomium sp. MPI-SDFR-AT-0129]
MKRLYHQHAFSFFFRSRFQACIFFASLSSLGRARSRQRATGLRITDTGPGHWATAHILLSTRRAEGKPRLWMTPQFGGWLGRFEDPRNLISGRKRDVVWTPGLGQME